MRLNTLLGSFPLSATLAFSAILAVPNVAFTQTKTGSGASLEETLNWLTDFLPKATGAPYHQPQLSRAGTFRTTSSIEFTRGCSIRVHEVTDSDVDGRKGSVYSIISFSLGDIDPKSISPSQNGDVIGVGLFTRGNTTLVQQVFYDADGHVQADLGLPRQSGVSVISFSDLASADRVVNALRHAAELCATQPF